MCKIPNLFVLMEERKITQAVLSKAIEVSPGNISDWKSGRSSPTIDALLKLAQYFNVSVDYLLGYSPDNNFDTKTKKLLTFASKLTEEQIDALIEMSSKLLGT